MRYRITHITRYTGDCRVSVGHNEAWLSPPTTPRQAVLEYKLEVSPQPSLIADRIDYFGNKVAVFAFYEGYDNLEITAHSEVDVPPPHALNGATSAPWEQVRDALREAPDAQHLTALEFVFASPRVRPSDPTRAYAAKSFPPNAPLLAGVRELAARIFKEFKYDPTATTVSTPVEEVLELRRGVCQDFAHLMIACLRSQGLAAAYVSGYLRTNPPPGKPRLVGTDASHAWVSVFTGATGWIDIDPTNNVLVGEDHIRIACGRDYGDVPPLKGVFIGGGQHTLSVSVDVAPVA
jgi:transglutaminase-like putative cysteine protease